MLSKFFLGLWHFVGSLDLYYGPEAPKCCPKFLYFGCWSLLASRLCITVLRPRSAAQIFFWSLSLCGFLSTYGPEAPKCCPNFHLRCWSLRALSTLYYGPEAPKCCPNFFWVLVTLRVFDLCYGLEAPKCCPNFPRNGPFVKYDIRTISLYKHPL